MIKDIIAEKIDIIEYAPDDWMNNDYVRKCKILPDCDIISGSDYIKGTYKGVRIEYCDLMLEVVSKETNDDGHETTTYTTVFHVHQYGN